MSGKAYVPACSPAQEVEMAWPATPHGCTSGPSYTFSKYTNSGGVVKQGIDYTVPGIGITVQVSANGYDTINELQWTFPSEQGGGPVNKTVYMTPIATPSGAPTEAPPGQSVIANPLAPGSALANALGAMEGTASQQFDTAAMWIAVALIAVAIIAIAVIYVIGRI